MSRSTRIGEDGRETLVGDNALCPVPGIQGPGIHLGSPGTLEGAWVTQDSGAVAALELTVVVSEGARHTASWTIPTTRW